MQKLASRPITVRKEYPVQEPKGVRARVGNHRYAQRNRIHYTVFNGLKLIRGFFFFKRELFRSDCGSFRFNVSIVIRRAAIESD